MRFLNYIIERAIKSDDKMTKQDLNNLERWADKLFSKFKIDVEFTKHFIERINDARNKKQITFSEMVEMFRTTYKKHGHKISRLPDGYEAVIHDMRSDINMPFVLDWDSRSKEFDLIAKTVMRKKNFKTSNTKLKVG